MKNDDAVLAAAGKVYQNTSPTVCPEIGIAEVLFMVLEQLNRYRTFSMDTKKVVLASLAKDRVVFPVAGQVPVTYWQVFCLVVFSLCLVIIVSLGGITGL